MKFARLPLALCLTALFAAVCHAQFYTLPGSFTYSLNSVNQVFDVSPDGKMAVALRNDPNTVHPALLTSFDPLTGAQFDSKGFGFGPLGVQLAKVGGSLRAAVLTSEGGPRKIYVFDVAADGKLTQLGATQLTSSISDSSSNIVLSGKGGVGFVIISSGDVVAFSLADASVVGTLAAGGVEALVMSETADGKRTLAFGNSVVRFADATNPAQMTSLGSVTLPSGNNFPSGMAFSADGKYLFAGNSSPTLSAIEVSTRQVAGTLSGGFFYGRVRVHENAQQRLLAVSCGANGQNPSSVVLVDATDVAHMTTRAQFAAPVIYKSDLQFSPDGTRLFFATVGKLTALNVPSFTEDWSKPVPFSPTREHQVMSYGQPAEVLGAWDVFSGLNFTSTFGSFPADQPDVTVSDSAAVAEGSAASFQISLSAPTTHRVTVRYSTSDGTAVSPSDYAGVPFNTSVVFEPGQTLKTVSVQTADDAADEFDETFKLVLTDADVGVITRAQGGATVLDDDPPPSLAAGDVSIAEGDSGTKTAAVEVRLSAASGKTVTVDYSTADGTASAGSDYAASSGQLTFNPGDTLKTIPLAVSGDTALEPDETVFVNLGPPANATLARAQAMAVILNDDPKVQFALSSVTVTEGADNAVTLGVTRGADTSATTTVSYETLPGTASDRSDYTAAYGTLVFAPGESSKSLTLFITDDALGEGQETFFVRLFGATGGAVGARGTVTVRINSDEASDGPNPVRDASFDTQFFVRQHYHDFLNREPDAAGLAFWSNEIEKCGTDQQCREVRKINVSAAFFLSIEFQETGYLVERTYKAAYGDTTSPNVAGTVPVIRLNEFLADARRIGRDLVVGQGAWEQQLEANKRAYALEFVQRQRFTDAFPLTMTPAEFVSKLDTNAGGVLSDSERASLSGELAADNTAAGRASVLRKVAEDSDLRNNEKSRAFVLMQYFGYLRRNPSDAPEPGLNFAGWKFWLGKLEEFNGNFVTAQMVKAFIQSDEYVQRFGQ